MIMRNGGRTYKKKKGNCNEKCGFYDGNKGSDCPPFLCGNIGKYYWSETMFSKILNWLNGGNQ